MSDNAMSFIGASIDRDHVLAESEIDIWRKSAAPCEPAPAVGWDSLVSLVADFLKDRDQALTPGEATDEERHVSAKLIAEIFAIDTPPAPPVDSLDLEQFAPLARWVMNCAGHGINNAQREQGRRLLAAIQARRQRE